MVHCCGHWTAPGGDNLNAGAVCLGGCCCGKAVAWGLIVVAEGAGELCGACSHLHPCHHGKAVVRGLIITEGVSHRVCPCRRPHHGGCHVRPTHFVIMEGPLRGPHWSRRWGCRTRPHHHCGGGVCPGRCPCCRGRGCHTGFACVIILIMGVSCKVCSLCHPHHPCHCRRAVVCGFVVVVLQALPRLSSLSLLSSRWGLGSTLSPCESSVEPLCNDKDVGCVPASSSLHRGSGLSSCCDGVGLCAHVVSVVLTPSPLAEHML